MHGRVSVYVRVWPPLVLVSVLLVVVPAPTKCGAAFVVAECVVGIILLRCMRDGFRKKRCRGPHPYSGADTWADTPTQTDM